MELFVKERNENRTIEEKEREWNDFKKCRNVPSPIHDCICQILNNNDENVNECVI